MRNVARHSDRHLDGPPKQHGDNRGAPDPSASIALTDLPGRPCPVAASLALVGEKWSLLAMREVSFGNHRFTDIARNTGAPRDRLAARLRALVSAGILEQREYSSAPARYGYHLTPAGKALMPVMRAFVQWGNTWALDQPRTSLQHHPTGIADHDLDLMEVCRTCGEEVRNRDIAVHVLAEGWNTSGPGGDPTAEPVAG